MADRDIRRNSFRQIISNKLDTSQFSGFKKKLLEAGLTTFNVDDYNRVLDRLSDELINPTPDLTPRIVSSNFVDTELILTFDDFNRIDMRLCDSGDQGTWWSPGQGIYPSSRLKILGEILTPSFTGVVDHALAPSNFKDENKSSVYFRGPLQVGTEVYKKDTNDELITPFYNTSWFAIESFDGQKEAAAGGSLETDLADANSQFLQQIYDDFTKARNPLQTIPLPAEVAAINLVYNDVVAYNNTTFTGGIIEIDGQGKVVSLYKVMNNYTPAGGGGVHGGPGTFINFDQVF